MWNKYRSIHEGISKEFSEEEAWEKIIRSPLCNPPQRKPEVFLYLYQYKLTSNKNSECYFADMKRFTQQEIKSGRVRPAARNSSLTTTSRYFSVLLG